MSKSNGIRSGSLAGFIVLLVLGLSGMAFALIGSDDSPPFPLNTKALSGVGPETPAPLADNLLGCSPNPFNPTTTIAFEMTASARVRLRVYDLQGRLVRTLLADESLGPGRHETTWDGRDRHGRPAASGVYVYRLVTDRFTGARSMTLMK